MWYRKQAHVYWNCSAPEWYATSNAWDITFYISTFSNAYILLWIWPCKHRTYLLFVPWAQGNMSFITQVKWLQVMSSYMFWNLRRLPSCVLYFMEHVSLCEKCFLWSKVCSFGELVPNTYLLCKNCHFCRKFPKSEVLCKWKVCSIAQNFDWQVYSWTKIKYCKLCLSWMRHGLCSVGT